MVDLRAHTIATAVTAYWTSTQPEINRTQQLQLLSGALQEVENQANGSVVSKKKLTLSARTAVNWLHRMGYDWKEVKKGIYKDGHERADVIQYRQEVFLKTLEELRPRMPFPIFNTAGEVVMIQKPSLPDSVTLCIPITHDECTCNANDGPHHHWIRGDENPIRSKSRGQGLHISEFITPWGRLNIGAEVSDIQLHQLGLHKREATEIIQCGGDIWWDQDHIVQQTMTAITIFEAAYPNCQALFLFDNATSHSAFAEDALRANRMNKSWGGKQPSMRDGYFISGDGRRVIQQMCFGQDQERPKKMWDKPKGLQVVLEERGLWPKEGLYLDCGMRKTVSKERRRHIGDKCCARQLLSQQPDFLAQKGRVQEVVEDRGHLILFYPKFLS